MKLSEFEKNIIKSEAKKIFGTKSKIFIFGSRVNDKEKGGDIDILVIPQNQINIFHKKLKYLTNVQLKIGLQKIDVVIYKNGKTSIEKEAIKNGIEL